MTYISNLLINLVASTTAVSSSAIVSFNTEQTMLQNITDNSLWAILIGILLGTIFLVVKGRKKTQI